MTTTPKPKLLFLVTEDWFFRSHFMALIRTAIAVGYEVVVATRVGADADAIRAEGARIVAITEQSRMPRPRAALRLMRTYGAIIRAERPHVLHAIALQPVVLGGLAAALAGVPNLVLAPTGLGASWVASGPMAILRRVVVGTAVRLLARRSGTQFVFENADDPRALGIANSAAGAITIVSGAGVAESDFPPLPPPTDDEPLKVAVVARMVASKGIAEAVEAVRLARAGMDGRGANVELSLWGMPDLGNPEPVTAEMLHGFSATPGVRWCGQAADARAVWRDTHVAMLLSRGGEGLPRTLVEAAACQRPIITTDVPGCRDVVTSGVEGFRVPPRNAAAAAGALVTLAADAALRNRMGLAARARFERDMTESAVQAGFAAVYRQALPAAV